MKKINFNANWTVEKQVKTSMFGNSARNAKCVHLPYDAMIHEYRDRDSANSTHGGYYPGGNYVYQKTFDRAEADGERVILEFEGVYRNSMIYVNGDLAGQQPYGYTDFYVDITHYLKPGSNEIKVVVHNQDGPNSRWYAGSGIYRPVWLWTGGTSRILPNGVFVFASAAHQSAVVTVSARITAEQDENLRLETVLTDPDGKEVGRDSIPVTIVQGETLEPQMKLTVANPIRWSLEQPALYRCETTLIQRRNGHSTVRKPRLASAPFVLTRCRDLPSTGSRSKSAAAASIMTTARWAPPHLHGRKNAACRR